MEKSSSDDLATIVDYLVKQLCLKETQIIEVERANLFYLLKRVKPFLYKGKSYEYYNHLFTTKLDTLPHEYSPIMEEYLKKIEPQQRIVTQTEQFLKVYANKFKCCTSLVHPFRDLPNVNLSYTDDPLPEAVAWCLNHPFYNKILKRQLLATMGI